MHRRDLLKLAALSVLPLPPAATALVRPTDAEFVLFGHVQLYAVHRFQYCEPRNVQAVLKLRSPLAGRPLPFTPRRPLAHLRVPGLVLGALAPRAGRRLPMLEGEWLEPSHKLALPSRFEILDTLFFARVQPDSRRATPAHYFTFGTLRESYALRRVGGAPDVEHLVRLKGGVREFLPDGTRANRAGLEGLVGKRDQLLLSELPLAC
jgi:hypothetical protein